MHFAEVFWLQVSLEDPQQRLSTLSLPLLWSLAKTGARGNPETVWL